MRVSDFSILWTHNVDSVVSSYNGQLSCLQRLVFSATHLFFHYSDYFFTPSLWQSYRFSLPQLVGNRPYHVVGVIPLTKGPTFQIGKGNRSFILKEYMD